jgi:hypothetical protein
MAGEAVTIDRYDYAVERGTMRGQRGDDEDSCMHKRAC